MRHKPTSWHPTSMQPPSTASLNMCRNDLCPMHMSAAPVFPPAVEASALPSPLLAIRMDDALRLRYTRMGQKQHM